MSDIPDDLYSDIESAIHRHMGHDGQSDEANDGVTDLMAEIAPLVARVYRSTPLAYGVFDHRTRRTPSSPEYVVVHVERGQENLHIDGYYAIYRRTDTPDPETVL